VFGLTPQDLGVTFDVNRSTSEIQLQVSEDRGLRPLMSNIQEYLTEEIVWDKSFGGMANNLAFRFTALNLKESTAKAAIYEKALAGVPWRFINEARIDEGREPIPEMEGKLIMATPQGAVDISDVPTVREMLEMQQASKAAAAAPHPTKSAEEMAESLAPLIVRQVLDAQPKKTNDIDLIGVVTGIQSLFKDHFERDRADTAAHTELLLKAVNDVGGTRSYKTPDITRDGNDKTVQISFTDEPKRTIIERDANGKISGVRQEPAP
jgi:flagellar basal body rod protein FlgC